MRSNSARIGYINGSVMVQRKMYILLSPSIINHDIIERASIASIISDKKLSTRLTIRYKNSSKSNSVPQCFFAEPNVSVSASGVPLSIKPTAPGISFRSAANQAGCMSACRSLDAAKSKQQDNYPGNPSVISEDSVSGLCPSSDISMFSGASI